MKSVFTAYMDVLKNVAKDKKQGDASEALSLEVIKDMDLTCAIRLLEQGYGVDKVFNALQQKSPVRNRLTAADGIKKYVNDVLVQVNDKWRGKSENAFELALKSYRDLANAVLRKYKDYDKGSFGLYQDGEIGLRLLRQDGFSQGIINAVISRNTLNKEADAAYFQKLKEGMAESAIRYKAIESIAKEAETELEIYRVEAQKYMERTNTKILSSVDEQQIIRQIYNKLIRQVKKQYPQIAGNQSRLDETIENTIKPMIKKMINDASPVYTEPGRNKTEYLSSMLNNFDVSYEKNKEQAEWGMSAARECYQRFLQEKQEQKVIRQGSDNDVVEEGQNAKNMLYNHHADETILKVLTEQSQLQPEKDLAERILVGAKACFHAEREILNFECQQAAKRKVVLTELDMSMKELYQQMMKERVEEYPTFVLEMAEPKADIFAVEKLMTRFPDYDSKELEEAIRAASPRAQLAGIKEDYPKRIINQAQRRLKIINERNERESVIQKKYNQLRGLSTEGIMNNNPMNRLKDGRTAVKMLRQHVNPDDVKGYLISFAKAAAITMPLLYANEILEKAQLVLQKGQAIRDYTSTDNENLSCKDTYMKKLQQQYKAKDFFQPQMDIRVMRDMLLENQYPVDDIKETIMKFSPIAEEPGRDAGYIEYIQQNAQRSIEQEKEKLKHYVVVPRPQQENAEDEYEHQRKRMEAMIDLPYTMEMDLMIAKSMLANGYDKQDVEQVLNSRGEQSAEEENYGEKLIHLITTITKEEEYALTATQEKVLVRSFENEMTETADS